MCDVCRTAERLRKWHARQGAHKGSAATGKGLTGVYTSSAGSEVQGASGIDSSTGVYIGGYTNSAGNEGPTGNRHEDMSGSGHTSLEQPRQSSQINHEEDDGDDNVADAGVTAPAGPAAVVGAISWSTSTSMGTTTATGTTAPASSTANLITLDDPLAFRPYKPKTATSTIGKISAKTPHLGVEVFTDLLLPPGTQNGSTSTTTKTPPQKSAVPAPTIPQFTPFVHQPPPKHGNGDPQGSNGGTEQLQSQPPASPPPVEIPRKRARTKAKKAPPTTPATPAHFPATSPYGSYPYGQYPYPYPYYLPPPYGMPPYAYPPPLPTGTGQDANAVASSLSTSPPYPYPYPYAQQPYGYPPPQPPPSGYQPPPPPPSGYHLPHPPYSGQTFISTSFGPNGQQQTYVMPAYGVPHHQHPPPPAPPPPTSSAAAPPPTTPTAPPKPSESSVPKVTKFSYYHYGVGQSDSPTTANTRKRRKVDPAYLERERLKLQAEKAAAARELGSYSLGAGGTTQPQQYANGTQLYGGTNGIVPIMANVAPLTVSAGQGSGTFGQDQGVTNQGGDSVGQGKEIANASPGSVEEDRVKSQPHPQRQCANKSCRRSIPTNATHTLCEKCKLRFKKHQVKTKQKFKLEPKKLVLPRRRGDVGNEAG